MNFAQAEKVVEVLDRYVEAKITYEAARRDPSLRDYCEGSEVERAKAELIVALTGGRHEACTHPKCNCLGACMAEIHPR